MTQANEQNQKILAFIVAGMLLVVFVMIGSIFMVTRRPVVVVVPSSAPAGATPVEAPPPAAPDAAATSSAVTPPEISVAKLSAIPAAVNPLDPFWEQLTAVEIPLVPQQVAEPMMNAGTVASVRIQAAYDDQRFVWRLNWAQEQPSAASDFGQFSDAVAIQFPLADGAPYTMGGPGLPVSILYWRAIWQKDHDEGFQDLASVHPNAFSDFYWFAPEAGPYPADKLLDADPMAQQWLIAASAGNPMADFKRKCPMEEIVAHGFGTSTHAGSSPGQAHGRWEGGRWYVVFERPKTAGDQLITRFVENPQQQLIAIAVWNGSTQDRGGKKNISNWIPMKIAL